MFQENPWNHQNNTQKLHDGLFGKATTKTKRARKHPQDEQADVKAKVPKLASHSESKEKKSKNKPSRKQSKNKYAHLNAKSKIRDNIIAQNAEIEKSSLLKETALVGIQAKKLKKKKEKSRNEVALSSLDQKDENDGISVSVVKKNIKKKKSKEITTPVQTESSFNTVNTETENDSMKVVKKKAKKKKKVVPNVEGGKIKSVSISKPTKTTKNSPFNINKLQNVLSTVKTELPEAASAAALSKTEGCHKKTSDSNRHSRKIVGPKSLRDKMQERLQAARFRFLNEQLYTTSGEEAYKLFSKDKDAFHVYHEGFQTQVEKWPTNPVDLMIQFILQRPQSKVVADFGCGEAKIASSVPNKVHSFDLVAINNHVTVCDVAHVPLQDASMDIGVFCLSLMGTNLTDFIHEANRVLKKKGTLLVAEVTSRFEKVGAFVRKMDKMGFDLVEKREEGKMFLWFEFVKTKKSPGEESRPKIELFPCQYKRR